MQGNPRMNLPQLLPWMRNLLLGLFGLYVAELVLRNAGVNVYALAWHSLDSGFQPWQPLTRFLVQGDSTQAVLGGLITVYFFVPGVWQLTQGNQMRDAVIAAAIGASVAVFLVDIATTGGALVLGWPVLAIALVALFGLLAPDHTILLMFVLPVSGKMMLWGTLGISLIGFLISPSMASVQGLGAWLGVYGWWNFRGPGARRRTRINKSKVIERELRRFEVIEGGKSQGSQKPDEWIN
ncbi:MAG: hypothetical protein GWP91_04335 [Rhodobacterales bacterium]|nr:hypothetical protein [Rhodobacterales bacterium]